MQEAYKAEAAPYLAAKQNVQHDPASVLAAAGFDLHEYGELAAKQIYAMSKAAADNPKAREQSASALRARKVDMELAETRAEMKQMRDESESRIQAEQHKQAAQQYMSGFDAAITAETHPNVTRYMTGDKSEIMGMLSYETNELLGSTNDIPKHAAVAARAEGWLSSNSSHP